MNRTSILEVRAPLMPRLKTSCNRPTVLKDWDPPADPESCKEDKVSLECYVGTTAGESPALHYV